MATEFKLPELGENIESGDLVRLMIKPGASITEGEPVMELETDKAVVEVPSSVTGTIGEVRVKEGDKLRVGQVIFTVENGAELEQLPLRKRKKTATQASPARAVATPVTPGPAVQSSGRTSSGKTSSGKTSLRNPSEAGHGDRASAGAASGGYIFVPRPASSGCRSWAKTSTPRSGAVDDLAGRERCRRPAGHGTRNDKAVVEVPSTVSGVVREVKVKEGQKSRLRGHLYS